MTGTSPLRLFLDRSTQGRRFVTAVRDLVDDVQTIDDRYGTKAAERTSDVDWIADATADGRILIGADKAVLRNPLERQAICRAGARYVVFGTNNLSAAHMIGLFTRYLPDIAALTTRPGPWVHRMSQHDIADTGLRCP